MTSSLQNIQETAAYLKAKLGAIPKVAVVLGSGLGNAFLKKHSLQQIAYQEIPHFTSPSVPGHAGILHRTSQSLILQGRFHYYEGCSPEEIVFPIRVLKLLGAQVLLLTNASGGLNPNYRVGELVLVRDHLNLTGFNPLCGPNLDLGPRFPSLMDAYSPRLRSLAKKVARTQKIILKEGVYAGITGPSYETPAEVKMYRKLGGDLIGMSTVPEVIAAVHAGLEVAVLSVITNVLSASRKNILSHELVLQNAQKADKKLGEVLEVLLCSL